MTPRGGKKPTRVVQNLVVQYKKRSQLKKKRKSCQEVRRKTANVASEGQVVRECFKEFFAVMAVLLRHQVGGRQNYPEALAC